MNNNLDNEKTNMQFSIICYIALIAFCIGGIAGTLITCFFYEYFS